MEALKELATTLIKAPRATVKTNAFDDGSIETSVFGGTWDGYISRLHVHPSHDIVETCSRVHQRIIQQIDDGVPAPPMG